MSSIRMDLTDALAECIEGVETGELTVEACLHRYPEYAAELAELLPVAVMLQFAPEVKPSASFRQEARSRLLEKLQPVQNENVTFLDSVRRIWRTTNPNPSTRRLSMAWIVSIITMAMLLLGGGVALASGDAVPGQALYSLDRRIEEVQLSLSRDPATIVARHLANAEERLAEAQELASPDDAIHFNEAIDGYLESIVSISQQLSLANSEDQVALGASVEEVLAGHNVELARIGKGGEPTDGVGGTDDEDDNDNDVDDEDDNDNDADDEDEDELQSNAENYFCVNGLIHPVGQGLSDSFNVDPTQVMNWFCGTTDAPGYGFGEIMLALQTADGDTAAAQGLLDMRLDGYGWGEIWQQLGLIGKPAGVNPGPPDDVNPGPPEDAGPPDDVNPGPPEDAGPPDDVNPGPPEDAGPPNDVNPGPPEDAGPPDDGDQGPPEDAGPPDDGDQGPPEDAGPPDDGDQGPPEDAGPPDDVSPGPPGRP